MILSFCSAWFVGVSIAAPVGPIGLLCIHKTLTSGMRGALLVGLGAALADSVYGLVSALGLSVVAHTFLNSSSFFKGVGGMFVLWIAYREAKRGLVTQGAQIHSEKAMALVGEVFVLTLTNPMTILSFLGIFASLGAGSLGVSGTVLIVFGVFIGSMTWWCILGSFITRIKHMVSPLWLQRIRWVSCGILALFGVAAIVSAIARTV